MTQSAAPVSAHCTDMQACSSDPDGAAAGLNDLTGTQSTTSSPTLRPCPFCRHQPDEGNLIDSIHPVTRDRQLWTAGCVDNEGGCNAFVLAGSRQEAIDQWNTRAADPA